MNLYYVEAVELKTDRGGVKQEIVNTHAVIARNEQQLIERCDTLFHSYKPYSSVHALNRDWDCLDK
jgi:hypothetical protein